MPLLSAARSTHVRSCAASPSSKLSTIAVALSAIGFGLSPLLATHAFAHGVTPLAASLLRVTVVALLLLPFSREVTGWRREALLVAVGGAISMIGFAGYFIALNRAPIAAATVVYYTYPAVVLVLSSIVWRRRMRGWEVLVSATVLVGVALTVGPQTLTGAEVMALAPAVAAPLGWASYLLILGGPAAAMPTMPKVFAGSIGGVVVLAPITFASTGWRVLPATPQALQAVALLTACTLAIPALLVTWGAAHSGERATAMVGSFEFAVAVVVGWLFLGDGLTAMQIVGVVLVLVAAGSAGRRTGRAHERVG